MKSLFSLMIFLFVAAQASATVPAHWVSVDKDFVLQSNVEPGSEIYYNCDSVSQSVTSFLEKLGARNIEAQCTGGISESTPALPADVHVRFQALQQGSAAGAAVVPANWKPVQIHSFDDCNLNAALLANLQDSLALKDARGTTRCAFGDSVFHFDASALFP